MKTDVEKAKVEFKEAKEYLDKLIPLLSADKPAQKKMMDNAKTMLKRGRYQFRYLPLFLCYEMTI